MNYETISDDVADLIMGSLKISGWISGVDGTRIIWYENRFGKTQKLMTPRPDDNPKDSVKKRWQNIQGLDPEAKNIKY